MKYKLLAVDIDGTIVKAHTNSPTPNIIKAIQRANEKIIIVLVSSRAWNDQKLIVEILGLKDRYHATENGTKVINALGNIEYDKSLIIEEVDELLKTSDGYFNEVGFCINSNWVKEYPKDINADVSTISLISASKSDAKKIHDAIDKVANKYTVTVGKHWNNPSWAVTLISHREASKGAGLHYIQKKLNISPDETIAVGDGASDVSMMQYASVKVAMGGAEPELICVANHNVGSVENDGLLDILNRFVFNA